LWQERLYAVIGPVEIRVDHRMVIFEREHFERALRSIGSGGIHEDVDFLEFRQDTGGQLFDRLDIANVARTNEELFSEWSGASDGFFKRLSAATDDGGAPPLFH